MLEQPKIALCLTLFLASASSALAGDRLDRTSSSTYGGPVQTWQDIERSREEIQRRIQQEYHRGAAAALNEKPYKHSHNVR